MKYKNDGIYRYKYIHVNNLVDSILYYMEEIDFYRYNPEYQKLNLYKKSEIEKEDPYESFIDTNSLEGSLLKIILDLDEISK